MLKTLRNAFKIPDLRKKLIYTFLMLVVIRLGSQLPAPRINSDYLQLWYQTLQMQTNNAFSLFDAITGGSFFQMSLFAMGIMPYITSSIVMNLLTIAVPKLEEMQKEGEDGRKKIAEYTRYVTVGLAFVEALAMAIGFGRQGLLEVYNFWNIMVVVFTLTAGTAFLMWIGERITEKGVGNGISIVLTINILARIPEDFARLYQALIYNKPILQGILVALVIILVVVAMIGFVVLLQSGERKIPVQYAKKMQGRKMVGGQSTHIPLKVNTAGVIPVIFASSLLQFPVVITALFSSNPQGFFGEVLKVLNAQYWSQLRYSYGVLFYIGLIIAFAYFYTSITFNPLEVANNMKKNGGFIPGIRPGKPTVDYLKKVLKHLILMGALGLTVIAVLPIGSTAITGVNVAFSGTSIIIVVGVVLETIKQIESQLLVRHYKGFLNTKN